MPAATLTEKGQIVIPAEIRERCQLTPGTQVEFGNEGGAIRLVVRRSALHWACSRSCEGLASFDDWRLVRRARRLGMAPAIVLAR